MGPRASSTPTAGGSSVPRLEARWPSTTASCTGKIGGPVGAWESPTGPAGTGGSGSGSGSGTGGSGTGGTTVVPPEVLPPFAPAAPAFARLTTAQYGNVMADLFGAPVA